MVETFADLIGQWPQATNGAGRKLSSIRTFADDVGISYGKAQMMKLRSSVAADYWPALLDAAKARSVPLTHKDLTRMRERRVRTTRSGDTLADAEQAA